MENKKIVIACVGDSITQGAGSSGAEKTYPAVLASLLGEGYTVLNFGAGGAGAQIGETVHWGPGNYSYVQSEQYRKSLESEPDLVIIMLGTNDAYSLDPECPETLDVYYNSLKQIGQTYAALPTKPEILLAGSPFRDDIAARTVHLREMVLPLQKKLAAEMGWRFCDFFTVTERDIAADHSLLLDGVHFTDAGYAYLAGEVYRGFFGT